MGRGHGIGATLEAHSSSSSSRQPNRAAQLRSHPESIVRRVHARLPRVERQPRRVIDEISPKFIAVNGLFRLEDRVVANARDAALKSTMRQISARIVRMRFPLPT